MSHLSRFVLPPNLDPADLQVLARHLAMGVVGEETICEHLGLTTVELARVKALPAFQELMAKEKRRLLTIEGQREIAEWKQALVEHEYFDRMLGLAVNQTTSAPAIIDGFKALRVGQGRGANGQGAGGPGYVVNIMVPGVEVTRVATVVAPPMVEGVAEPAA